MQDRSKCLGTLKSVLDNLLKEDLSDEEVYDSKVLDHNNNSGYVLSNKVWTEIGNIMNRNRKNMPLDFGRPPINIQRYSATFKAEDRSNWVILYSHFCRIIFQKGI